MRITTAQQSTIEGTLFTADPITNLVAINTADPKQAQAGYHIFPVSRIQSFQLLSLAPPSTAADGPSFSDAVPSVHALDIRALKNREATAIGKLHENEARRGKGVTREAQDIFDAISRTMPVRWDGTNIVVADAVSIAAPYRPDDCRPLVAGDTAALLRVRKVVRIRIIFFFSDGIYVVGTQANGSECVQLEMERQKIELRNASAAFSRPSGAPKDNRASTANNPSPGPGAAGQRKGG